MKKVLQSEKESFVPLVLDYHNRFLICWHGHTSFTWGPQAIMMINIIVIINRIEIWGSDRLSAAQ